MTEIKFAKTRDGAIIPSKLEENAGYDIYACFDEDYITIAPHETKLIPTGITSALDTDCYFQIEERGSTGSKGIKKSAGVIDSGFRGEWKVAITNSTDNRLFISKLSYEDTVKDYYGAEVNSNIVYSYYKAIAQAVLHRIPEHTVEEISYDNLKAIPSIRGTAMLGSSGK